MRSEKNDSATKIRRRKKTREKQNERTKTRDTKTPTNEYTRKRKECETRKWHLEELTCMAKMTKSQLSAKGTIVRSNTTFLP